LREYTNRFFMPTHFIAVKASPLIAEGQVFAKGLCVVALGGVQSLSGGFSEGGNTRENTEKMLWRMAQEVQRPRKLYFGASSIAETDLSDHIKGLEVSVGKKAPMINVYFDPESADRTVKIVHTEGACARGAAGMSLFDAVQVAIKSGAGFHPLGSSGIIGRDEERHNILTTVNGKDAADFYKKYFGEKIVEDVGYAKRVFRRYPLGVKKNAFYYDVIKPHMIEERKRLQCMQDVRGDEVRIMIPTREGILTEARSAALEMRGKLGTDKAVLMFDVKERQRFFGTHYDRCVAAVKDALGPVPMIGGVFYALGFMFDSDDVALGHSVSEHSFALLALGS